MSTNKFHCIHLHSIMSPLYKPCMLVKGGQISERGDKFPRKYGLREAKFPRKSGPGGPNFRGGQIFGGAKFPVTPGKSAHINSPLNRLYQNRVYPFKFQLFVTYFIDLTTLNASSNDLRKHKFSSKSTKGSTD